MGDLVFNCTPVSTRLETMFPVRCSKAVIWSVGGVVKNVNFSAMEMGMNNIKLVATDLDGTFLKNDRSISEPNLLALKQLGDRNITRVVATGRNLRKVREVIPDDIPFDYIIYSSGAGVFDWKRKQHLFNQNIGKEAAQSLARFFIREKLNFHAFFPAPENHNHWYFRGENHCEEFERYFQFNKAFALDLNENEIPDSEVCQFLLIIPEDTEQFGLLKIQIEGIDDKIRVIRTTSPITQGYIWVEIFHRTVSKGNGVKQICDWLGIDKKDTFGIGNDYNDLDLLEFTGFSFLTDNAPPAIKSFYPTVPSNDNDAFAWAVQPIVV